MVMGTESFVIDDISDLHRLAVGRDLDSELLDEYLEAKVNGTVVVCYYGRSGSYFLYQLLENHPNLIAMNSELREFWKISDHYFLQNDFETVLLFFFKTYAKYINSSEWHHFLKYEGAHKPVHIPRDLMFRLPEGYINESEYHSPDIYEFVGYLYAYIEKKYAVKRDELSNLSLTQWQFFESLHIAWALALKKPYQPNFYLLYNLHVPDKICVNNLAKYNCYVLHTVRSPAQTFGSHIKRYLFPKETDLNNVNVEDIPLNVLEGILNDDCYLLDSNREKEFAIRLEDIHKDNRTVQSLLLNRLGLCYSPCVEEETFNGGAFAWKNSDGSQTKGFGGDQMQKLHEDLLTRDDVRRLESILSMNYEKWGYSFKEVRRYIPRSIFKLFKWGARVGDLADFDFLKNIEQNYKCKIPREPIDSLVQSKLRKRSEAEIFETLKI